MSLNRVPRLRSTMPLSVLLRRSVRKCASVFADHRHAARVRRHRASLPPLSDGHRAVVETLRRERIATLPLAELGIPATERFLPQAEAVAERLETLSPENYENEYGVGFRSAVPVGPSVIAAEHPELFLWGLDDKMLDLAEHVIGLPVAYHGVTVRKDLVDHQQRGSRKWHQDAEDRRVLRVLVYLSDVLDEGDGPFEYLPPDRGLDARSFAGSVTAGMMTDDEVRRVVPPEHWRRVLGPRHTVILATTDRLFHRGRPPQRERKVLSLYYTSRQPTNTPLCKQYSFQTGMPHLRTELTQRQRACLWDYERLLPPATITESAESVG